MADNNLFAAIPALIKQGGNVTDQVADYVNSAYNGYNHFYIDWNNPIIGEPGDETVKAIRKVYGPAYNQSVLALGQLRDAIKSASDLTTQSGVNFNVTQQDALDHINGINSGRSA